MQLTLLLHEPLNSLLSLSQRVESPATGRILTDVQRDPSKMLQVRRQADKAQILGLASTAGLCHLCSFLLGCSPS